MEISQLTVESFEAEDKIIITTIKDNGEPIEEDVAQKLFSLSAKIENNGQKASDEPLKSCAMGKIAIITEKITARNGVFFDEEINKLDGWAEDIKKSLEIELRQLDINIKAMKTNAKKILNLGDKIKLQREIKETEKKRK